MKIEALTIEDENFYIGHLSDSSEDKRLISDFKALNGAKGLENYLKYQAMDDEKSRKARTYLVKDKLPNELAGYFSLRSGLITIQAYQKVLILFLLWNFQILQLTASTGKITKIKSIFLMCFCSRSSFLWQKS